MSTWAKSLSVSLVAATVVLTVTPPASAQWTNTWRPSPLVGNRNNFGFNPWYGAGAFNGFNPYTNGDPYGGYMQGAASVISAQGQQAVNFQRAFQIKEQTRQMQTENRRRVFDEWLYERANTPTLNDERERIQREENRRARNTAPETEIWAGTALNHLLTNIQAMRARGGEGPTIALYEGTLKQINLTTTGQGNAGGLRVDSSTSWPVGLQLLQPEAESKALRESIDKGMAEAKSQAMAGKLDARTVQQLERNINSLRQAVQNSPSGELSFTDFTSARRFLNTLADAVAVLKQPGSRGYLDGQFAAKGNTVSELIDHMTKNGLRFAAAIPGEEGAYNALYRALVQYDIQTDATLSSVGPSASSGQ